MFKDDCCYHRFFELRRSICLHWKSFNARETISNFLLKKYQNKAEILAFNILLVNYTFQFFISSARKPNNSC